MKLTAQIRLLPSPEQAAKMLATLERFNEAANWVATVAYERQIINKILLQKHCYAELRERFGLSSQMACLCVHRVAKASRRDPSRRPTFRRHAGMIYDPRIFGFRGVDRVSLLTLDGRLLLPMICGASQREQVTTAEGQADLVRRKDGKWFLLLTVDLPDGAPTPTTDFIGVDLGLANLTTDSDGAQFSGSELGQIRGRYHEQRRKLQQAGAKRKARDLRPKRIRRKLKNTSARESRFRRHTNHCISKQLVAKAKDSRRGIALEDLEGIRERIRFRKPQRARMSGWAFSQLRAFIEYKARLAGVPVVLVGPARHFAHVLPMRPL